MLTKKPEARSHRGAYPCNLLAALGVRGTREPAAIAATVGVSHRGEDSVEEIYDKMCMLRH